MDKQTLIGKTLSVLEKATVELELPYLETGMKARVVSVDDSDPEVTVAVLNVVEFEDVNKPLERNNYYDRRGVACLTAREAGFCDDEITVYLPPLENIGQYFCVDDASFVEEFRDTRGEGEGYIAWLERQLLEARNS